jgi:type VI secretion system protein ImpK
MSNSPADAFLLARFADFYQEVAAFKQAQAEARLADRFRGAGAEAAGPLDPADLAAQVSGALLRILARQLRDVREGASSVELDAYMHARYAMAALADEIFILELAWTGRQAWRDNLLEFRLWRSRDAGQRLFLMIDELIHRRDDDALATDLASVYLLVLQLGFRGIHRGEAGAERLQYYRKALLDIVQRNGGRGGRHAFPQAYLHNSGKDLPDRRLAPLSAWLDRARLVLLAYLILSSVVWAGMLLPKLKTFGVY